MWDLQYCMYQKNGAQSCLARHFLAPLGSRVPPFALLVHGSNQDGGRRQIVTGKGGQINSYRAWTKGRSPLQTVKGVERITGPVIVLVTGIKQRAVKSETGDPRPTHSDRQRLSVVPVTETREGLDAGQVLARIGQRAQGLWQISRALALCRGQTVQKLLIIPFQQAKISPCLGLHWTSTPN